MSTTGSISLKVLGSELDFDNITKSLQLTPTNIYKKGVIYNKTIGETENDCWYYVLDIEENETVDGVMQRMLLLLRGAHDFIEDLSKSAHVAIRCAIQSEMAQIYFELSPETLKEIGKLSTGIEFSIFSWGEAEDSKQV